jgi:hypothetical protein
MTLNDDEKLRERMDSSSYIPCCCECHQKPSVLDPIDLYIYFLKDPDMCSCFGVNTLEDIEKHVIKTFIRDSWPKYLRDKYE